MSEPSPANFFVSKMTKRQLVWVLPLLAISILVWAIQTGRIEFPIDQGVLAEQTEPSPPALPVNVTTISRVNSFKQPRTFTGTVRARNRSDLAFELGGKLADVLVDEGDEVEKGQVIATLDTATLLAQKTATIANRQQAEAVLAELTAGPRAEKIEAARANVVAATSEFNRAVLNLERRKSLRDSLSISAEEFDQVLYTEKTARANLDAAKQQLAELLAGTRQEKIDAQKSVVSQLEASISEIDVMLAKSELTAPFSGTVTKAYLDPGTIAQASVPVIRLVEQQHLEAWIGFPVSIVGEMKVGDKQNVLVENVSHIAVVSAKIPELDPATRTQTVLLEFDEEAGNSVVSGQLCEISIESIVHGSGFWIPSSALSKGVRGLWAVMVVVPAEDGKDFRAEKRDIEIINTIENSVLARGTINQGDLIVVDGLHRIADGQRVTPNETN